MGVLATTVILVGVLQSAVLAPVLWLRRANRLANRILAVLVAAVGLMLLLGVLQARYGFAGHPHLLGTGAPLPFLFGPLVYLYVVALTRPVLRVDWRWLFHALPFVADVLYMAQVFYGKDGEEKMVLALVADSGRAPASFYLVKVLGVIQALVYLALAWRALEKYRRKIRAYYSDLARIDLRWLRALVLANAGVWLVVLAGHVVWMIGGAPSTMGTAISLGSAATIFLTGYVSLWQPELVQKATAARAAEEAEEAPAPAAPAPGPSPARPPPRYQRNRLDDAEAKTLVARLLALMTEEEIFREGSLALPALADALGVTPHMVSQLLNVHVGKSFFIFVNSYRAEALKRALADPAQAGRGILELALEAGFNSKSTLNSFFKAHTGLTPTEFRARAQSKIPVRSRA